jgi:hypothetical protein
MQVEVLREGEWLRHAELCAGGSIDIGREAFVGAELTRVSRRHIVLARDAGDGITATAVGSNKSFLLTADGERALVNGVPTPLELGVVLSCEKRHLFRVRVMAAPAAAAAPPPSAEGVHVLSSSNDEEADEEVEVKPAVEDLTSHSPLPPPPPRRRRAVPSSSDEVIDLIDLEAANGVSANGVAIGVSGRPLLPGEQLARQQRQRRTWTLKPSRSTEDTPEEQHYRLAESAFCRGGGQASQIAAIEYHFHPELESRWHAKKAEYDDRFGVSGHTIIFAFHGTKKANAEAILRDGFKISKLGSTTHNRGVYGAGTYFSESFMMSSGYNQIGGTNDGMLLCKLLVGKPFVAPQGNGAPLQPGYTSHVADPRGTEVVIFDEAAMLPVYVVKLVSAGHPHHYQYAAANQHAALPSNEPLKGLGGSGGRGADMMAAMGGAFAAGAGAAVGALGGAFGFPGAGHVLGGAPGGKRAGESHHEYLVRLAKEPRRAILKTSLPPGSGKSASGGGGAKKRKAAGATASTAVEVGDDDDDDEQLQEALRRSMEDT